MKYLSWNVNGIRACLQKGFEASMRKENPDVICLQEVKACREDVDMGMCLEYHTFWNAAEKKGYSGTAVFSKVKPVSVNYGLGIPEHDREGRVITLEFEDSFLVNVYTPNAQRELLRLAYRQKEWDVAFLEYIKTLEKRKPVIFCGDLNVAHTEIDLANPKSNVKNAGFTPEERQGFDHILEAGFIDSFREFEKGGGHYSWWSYRANARARNIGWRIDYFCISPKLRPRLRKAWILPEVEGSDHCPVAMELA